MVKILDGKLLSNKILEQLKFKIRQERLSLTLAIILCGDDPASVLYTNMKKKQGLELGIEVDIGKFPDGVIEEIVINKIKELNFIADGIVVQLPLPKHLNKRKILSVIDPDKDVDGLTEISLGKIACGDESYAPATPKGVIRLLEEYSIDLTGKKVTIINHSELVGKPLALMFLNRGATVTVCHEFTMNLISHTQSADIVVSAVGKPSLLTGEMIKKNSIVIDVGISKVAGKIAGDVNAESVKPVAAYLSPVPGGIGPMTLAMLFENVVNKASKSL